MSRIRVGIVGAMALVLGVMLAAGLARDAEGSHQPIVLAAIDTNIAGNSASVVGTIEPCTQPTLPVGGTRQIDLVLKGVPSEGLAGAAFDLAYDPSKVRITAFNAAIMMPDAFWSFSDTMPDTDGRFRVEMADFVIPPPPDPPGYVSGDGALVRFTVEGLASGSTSVYLTDAIEGDFKPNFLDGDGGVYQVAVIAAGQITVGPTTCADPTPTPTASPTIAPTPSDWDPAVKKLNGWTWYRYPNGLTTTYSYGCGSSAADCRSRWTVAYDQAIDDWNSRPTGARLSKVGEDVSTAEVAVISLDTILGQPSLLGLAQGYTNAAFNPCPTPPATCTVRYGDAYVADDAHVGAYGTTYDRRATVAHEIGHLLALAHESVSFQCGEDETGVIPHSAMAYDCVDPPSLGGAGENWVQDFDVCGVNTKYPTAAFGDAGCLDQPTQGSYFYALPPCRLLDTRNGTGAPAGKLGAGQTLNVQVAQICGVTTMPQVTAVVLNVTVTEATAASFVTVYPSDASRPLTSNLNFGSGETRPNLVTVRIGTDGANAGKLKFFNATGQTHVIADVAGYYSPIPGGGARYNPLTPARIMDTRTGINGVVGKFGAGQTVTFQVAGRGGVPANGVKAIAMNVTVTEPTASSYLTIYPADQNQLPTASNLNFVAGQTVPNLVTARVSIDGKIKLFNLAGATHVIIDVMGWYTTGASGELFHAVTPARGLDTRVGTGGRTGKLGANEEMMLRVAGVGGLPPAGVSAVALNGTVTEPTANSYLTVFPANEGRPLASNLNFVAGQTVPNAAILKVAPDGRIKIYNQAGGTHVIVDVAGWFGP